MLKSLRKVGTERWNLANAFTEFFCENLFVKMVAYAKKCSQI